MNHDKQKNYKKLQIESQDTKCNVDEPSGEMKHLANDLEPNNMNTCKVSEESTISVSKEIKRFQHEINKVCDQNENFPSWKKERLGLNVKIERVNCWKDSSTDSPQDLPPRKKPNLQESLKAPQLPPKMTKGVENPQDEDFDDINRKKSDEQQSVSHDPIEEEYVPVLPSVKKLANKFQIMQENENKQILLTEVSFKSL